MPWTNYGPELDIDVLDIGQGDSILIQTPEHYNILIDGGPDESVIDQIDQVLPFWDRTIDIIMPSHPQADHINGLASVLQRFTVKQVLDTPLKSNISSYISIKKSIEQQKVPETYFLRGQEVKIGEETSIESLWPPSDSDWSAVKDPNDVAEVLLLRYGSFKALFTGDAGANIDQQLEQLGSTPKVDVLKVGHHGSKTGTDTEYLQDLRPLISVISVGADNRYGHPAPSTITQLQQVGSAVWRTDQAGRVEISVNRSGISVNSTK